MSEEGRNSAATGSQEMSDVGAIGPVFFGGGGRTAVLEQLSHLTAWARSLVMLTGPLGAGKTMLLDRVVKRVMAQHPVNVVRPPVGFLSNGHELLRHVAADLGARVPEQIDATGLTRLVMQQVVAELAEERSTLLVLDDAHELSANVLRAVAQLVDEARDSRGLNVLIAGEPALPEQLAKATPERENWHEIRLRPLPLNEARQFLKLCRPEALEALDAAEFQALYRKAGGWPGRFIAQIDGETRQRSGRWRFPLVQQLWLGAMVGLLVVVLVVQHRSSNAPKPAVAATPVAANANTDRVALPALAPAGSVTGATPPNRTDVSGVAVVPLVLPSGALATASALPPSQQVLVPKPPDSLPDVAPRVTPLELALRAAPVVAQPIDEMTARPPPIQLPAVATPASPPVSATVITPVVAATPARLPSVTPTPPAVAVARQPAPAAAKPTAAKPTVVLGTSRPVAAAVKYPAAERGNTDQHAPIESAASAPPVPPALPPVVPPARASVPSSPNVVSDANHVAAPKPAPGESIPASKSPRGAAADNGWARAQPPSNFTVQLLGAAAMRTVQRYIAGHPGAELRVLRTRRGTSDWFVVVLGTFHGRSEAQAALQQLGGEKTAAPWVRTFDGLQKDLPE